MKSEATRVALLRTTKRRATVLLGAIAVLFVAVTVWGGDATWVGYVQAFAEASLVGGLADWFAVTALFRHPLGIPIPHTAIVVERQEQFAETLGDFVQESLLTPDVIVERIREADLVGRVAAWLVVPGNAARVAGQIADAGVQLADLIEDDDVHRALEGVMRDRLASLDIAPMAAKALRYVTEGDRHEELLDSAFRGLDLYLDEHREELRHRFGEQSPWWLPGAVEDQIFERLLGGARAVLAEVATDHDHQLRRQLDERIDQLVIDLETSPELAAKAEAFKQEVLGQPALHELAASMWSDAKTHLRVQAADPDSELRARLAVGIAGVGARLRDDPALRDRATAGVDSLVAYGTDRFQDEVGAMVTNTIARWDTAETARRLELLLGPDLQYIRINDTVVGGLAGIVLHAVVQLLH